MPPPPGLPPPPPPPPPKSTPVRPKTSTAPPPKPPPQKPKLPVAATGASAIFDEIRAKGDSIASGLRKVNNDDKRYKQTREAQPVTFEKLEQRKVAVEQEKKAKESKPAENVVSPDATFKLEDNKWLVKSQSNVALEIQSPLMNHNVFISKCMDVTLVIKSKVNSVTLVECERVNIELEAVVSSIDISNCKKIELAASDLVPFAILDKSHSISIHLSHVQHSRATKVVTSSCSTVNIVAPDRKDVTDMREYPVPEQFVSKLSVNPKGGFSLHSKASEI